MAKRLALPNPTTPKDSFRVIKYQRLAGRHAELRIGEMNADSIDGGSLDSSVRGRVLVSNLSETFKFIGNVVDQPVNFIRFQRVAGKIVVVT